MAIETVEITLPGLTGFTLTAKLYADGSDTLVDTIATLTEATNRKGTYTGTTATGATGVHLIVALEGTTVRGVGYAKLRNSATGVTVVAGRPVDLLAATQASIDAIITLIGVPQVTLADDIADIPGSVAGAAAANVRATGFVLTTGTESSGTFSTTHELDNVSHQLVDDAGTLEAYYEFNVGAGAVATQVTVNGRLNGVNDTVDVFAYNWGATAWEQIGNRTGQGGSTNVAKSYALLAAHVGTGGNEGLVRIRYLGTGLTSATLHVDQILVSYSALRLDLVDAPNPTAITAIQLGLATTVNVDAIPAAVDSELSLTHGGGSWESAGAGSGARTITYTVDDGVDPLENVRVSLVEGVNRYLAVTDVNGNCTFNVDDATYVEAATKPGYSYAGGSLVVTGNDTPSISMTLITITPPPAPNLCTLQYIARDEFNDVEPGSLVSIKMVEPPASDTGTAFDTKTVTKVAAAVTAVVEFFTVQGAKYDIWRGSGPKTRITIPLESTAVLGSFLGKD